MVVYGTTQSFMFRIRSRVTVSSIRSTYTLASSVLVGISSNSFRTSVGLKGLLIFDGLWSFFGVFSSKDLFHSYFWLVPSAYYFSRMVIGYFYSVVRQWSCQLFWQRCCQFILLFAIFGQRCCRLCSISISVLIDFSWHPFYSLGVKCVVLESNVILALIVCLLWLVISCLFYHIVRTIYRSSRCYLCSTIALWLCS